MLPLTKTESAINLIKTIKPGARKIPFRLLKEGKGGLVYFYHDSCPTRPEDDNHLTFTHQVGMYGATNSTGVYFALSEQSCFCAHIKSYVRDAASNSVRYTLSELQGRNLKKQVTERLHATLTRMGHNVSNAGVTRPYTTHSLFMVKPHMYASNGTEQAGAYVAQAVWDYLGLKKDRDPVDTEHSGFILQHLQKPFMVPSAAAEKASGEKPTEMEHFKETEEEGEHIGDWTFEIEAKEDWEADKEQECS